LASWRFKVFLGSGLSYRRRRLKPKDRRQMRPGNSVRKFGCSRVRAFLSVPEGRTAGTNGPAVATDRRGLGAPKARTLFGSFRQDRETLSTRAAGRQHDFPAAKGACERFVIQSDRGPRRARRPEPPDGLAWRGRLSEQGAPRKITHPSRRSCSNTLMLTMS